MKNMVYLVGLVVLAIAGYNLIAKKESDNVLENPIINPTLQTQPEQKYPMQMNIAPRSDNADQPWYSGSREFFGSANSDVMPALSESNDSLMIYNTNDFWNSLESKYVH